MNNLKTRKIFLRQIVGESQDLSRYVDSRVSLLNLANLLIDFAQVDLARVQRISFGWGPF